MKSINIVKNQILFYLFDDGFYDFLKYAMPILQKYNIQVNQNIILKCVTTGKPVWDVMLGDLLNQITPKSINNIDFNNFKMKLTSKNKSQYALSLTAYLKKQSKKERDVIWHKIDKLIVDKKY